MTRPVPSTRLPALGAVLVLLAAAGATACGAPAADGPIDPIVMTDSDGVLHGPDEGAAPVSPADPAPAGRHVTTSPPTPEQGLRGEAEPAAPPAPPEPDDDPEPAPPSPDHDDDTDEPDEPDEPDDEIEDEDDPDDEIEDDEDDEDESDDD